jgi:hypothetical protein
MRVLGGIFVFLGICLMLTFIFLIPGLIYGWGRRSVHDCGEEEDASGVELYLDPPLKSRCHRNTLVEVCQSPLIDCR